MIIQCSPQTMPKLVSRLDTMLVEPLVIDRETLGESSSGEFAFLRLPSAMEAGPNIPSLERGCLLANRIRLYPW